MADQDEKFGHPAIPLPANGFELSDLESGLKSAVALKTDDKRAERINKVLLESAAHPETIERGEAIAIPEGHKLGEIENAFGETIKAPVAIPADKVEDTDVTTQPTRPAPTPTAARTVEEAGKND